MGTWLIARTLGASKITIVASEREMYVREGSYEGMIQVRDVLRRGHALTLLGGDLVPPGIDGEASLVLVGGVGLHRVPTGSYKDSGPFCHGGYEASRGERRPSSVDMKMSRRASSCRASSVGPVVKNSSSWVDA